MKKSELKSLLRIIVKEAIQSKGLSGFKKSSESVEHTEKVADAKTLTPNSEPKEKKEGKKLPVKSSQSNTETDHFVSDKSTPQPPSGEKKEGKALPVGGHGSLKESILAMIREEIEEYRTKGALGAKNPNRTTPVKTYNKQGINPNLGRPSKIEPTAKVGKVVDIETKDAIERILSTDSNVSDNDILNQLKTDTEAGQSRNLDPKFVKDYSDEIRKSLSSERSVDQEEAPEAELQQIAQAEKSSGDKKAQERAKWLEKLRAAKLRANKPLGR